MIEQAPLLALLAAVPFSTVLLASKILKLNLYTQDLLTGAAFGLLLVPLARLELNADFAKPCHLIAGFSYTLYVTHFPVLAFLSTFLIHNVRVAPGLAGLISFAEMFTVATLCAYLISCVFERNTTRIQTSILRRMGAIRRPPSARMALRVE
jgi:peptidoglycan/LPS O-acetylase OafA/YrhL